MGILISKACWELKAKISGITLRLNEHFFEV